MAAFAEAAALIFGTTGAGGPPPQPSIRETKLSIRENSIIVLSIRLDKLLIKKFEPLPSILWLFHNLLTIQISQKTRFKEH